MSADPYSLAQLGLSVYSIFSGAGAEASANQSQIGSNNIQIEHINNALGFTKDTAQAQREMAEDEFKFGFEEYGKQSGTQWEGIGRTMEQTLDLSKFANMGSLQSDMDYLSDKMDDAFTSNYKRLERQRELGLAEADEFEISTVSSLENQKKLLKKQNQYLSKRDKWWEVMF